MADIFDKVFDGLNKGVAAVGAGSKAVIEKAKVNTAIKTLETEKRHFAETLGMKVYDAHVTQSEASKEDVDNLIEIMRKHDEQIAFQYEILRRIEAEEARAYSNTCRCGYMNNKNAHFCAKCGESLQ